MPQITIYRTTLSNMTEDGNYDEEQEEEKIIDCNPDEFDIEDNLSVVDIALHIFEEWNVCGVSSSVWHNRLWYITDENINYHTGETTIYSLHLSGFSDEEEQAIYLRWKGEVGRWVSR